MLKWKIDDDEGLLVAEYTVKIQTATGRYDIKCTDFEYDEDKLILKADARHIINSTSTFTMPIFNLNNAIYWEVLSHYFPATAAERREVLELIANDKAMLEKLAKAEKKGDERLQQIALKIVENRKARQAEEEERKREEKERIDRFFKVGVRDETTV